MGLDASDRFVSIAWGDRNRQDASHIPVPAAIPPTVTGIGNDTVRERLAKNSSVLKSSLLGPVIVASLIPLEPAIANYQSPIDSAANGIAYGCEVATARGDRQLVRQIGKATGADVAAAIDETGSARLGEGWDLDFSAGTIEAQLPVQTQVLETDDAGFTTTSNGTVVATIRTSASGDDIEAGKFGAITRQSSDLELGVNDGQAQKVGLRFNSVTIPPGATITKAYIQFQTDEKSSDLASFKIKGIDTDSALAFTDANGNLSPRPRTTATVSWSPKPWLSVGAESSAQRTPNLASIVQEIVDRPDWSAGNSMAFLCRGSGSRVAKSYDGSPAAAPSLHLEYTLGSAGSGGSGGTDSGSNPNPTPDPTDTSNGKLAAFPGAEGFGTDTPGGRGGRIIEVTNLNDSGPGSLRAAIEAVGPRIVVFRVGGTIQLDTKLAIENPYITIAGQTAPGGGITLRNSAQNSEETLKIKTHDVVVRYLSARPGSNPDDEQTIRALSIGTESQDVYNVVVDHSSFSWATDEVLSSWFAPHDFTIQWSTIAEGLENSTHPEGSHSAGSLIGSKGVKNISIHHNLFAHSRHRNPEVKASGTVDIVNNVIYNSGFGDGWSSPIRIDGEYGEFSVNIVGNYLKPGLDTGSPDWMVATKNEPLKIFIQGNKVPTNVMHPNSTQWVVSQRNPAPAVTTLSAEKAYEEVLASAGASQGLRGDGTFYFRRDPVDRRIINDVKQGTGRIIDDPSGVGGWPTIAAGTPYADTDRDGMGDEFENLYGSNPNDPSDSSKDTDGDGYTNVEEFLNGTLPGQKA